MNNLNTAINFLKYFCSGDVNGLGSLLAMDIKFKGPLHSFSSSDAYLESLKNDPPEKCAYRILSVTENEDSVSIYYDYVKSNGILTIAQLFKFKNRKISEILLVFDGRGLLQR